MFGDGTVKEQIYQELKWIFQEEYGDWDNSEDKLSFTTNVLYVLNTMFGDW
jgi:hypothetical protein